MKSALQIALLVLSLPEAFSWSNERYTYDDYVQYGTHDMIINIAHYRVRDCDEGAVSYIFDRWGGFLYYTEWPDMGPEELGYPDWENHNYDFYDFGYRGGSPDRGGPGKVGEVYSQTVENLTVWLKTGSQVYANNASILMSILSHYLADITMPMHTDDTSGGSPEHTGAYLVFPDGKVREHSYHSLYEKAVDWGVKVDYPGNVTNAVYDITHSYQPRYIKDIENFVLEVAMISNGYSEEFMASDPLGSVVGSRYWWFVSEVKVCVDMGQSYNSIPGMSEELYYETIVQLRMAVESMSDTMYSAWIDANSGF